jgi:hypothetical protein
LRRSVRLAFSAIVAGQGFRPSWYRRLLGSVDGLLRTGSVCGLRSPERHAHDRGPLSPEEVGLADSGWIGETPLWFYVLKEADARHDGERLGPI